MKKLLCAALVGALMTTYSAVAADFSKKPYGLVYDNAITENVVGKVNIHPVSYTVDGIRVAANVYTPSGYDPKKSYPAIVVAHPNGGVKEQVAGLFAEKLAGMGYILSLIHICKAYAGGLNGNDAAKDFAAKLPLKLKFEDFGSTERISYLPKSLNLGSASRSCDPQKGDITYYIPWGNLAVFVRDFRPSDNLVPLGKLSPEALKAIQESGSKDVEISLVK